MAATGNFGNSTGTYGRTSTGFILKKNKDSMPIFYEGTLRRSLSYNRFQFIPSRIAYTADGIMIGPRWKGNDSATEASYNKSTATSENELERKA